LKPVYDFSLDPAVDNYAVFGNPVAHSKSPFIHRAFAEQTRQPIHYQAVQVPVGEFETALPAFGRSGGKGLNITLPFKEAACQAVNRRTARAEQAGAVNTVTFRDTGIIEGDNTDGAGLLADLDRNHIDIADKRILLLGAGGAARGILGPLLVLRPDCVRLVNRTRIRAELLREKFRDFPGLSTCSYSDLQYAGRFDLLINATPSGLTGTLPPLPDHLIARNGCVYDLAYSESETVFVSWGRQHGAAVALDGLGMLVEQAAESFYIWRGVRPDPEPVIRMLRES